MKFDYDDEKDEIKVGKREEREWYDEWKKLSKSLEIKIEIEMDSVWNELRKEEFFMNLSFDICIVTSCV